MGPASLRASLVCVLPACTFCFAVRVLPSFVGCRPLLSSLLPLALPSATLVCHAVKSCLTAVVWLMLPKRLPPLAACAEHEGG